MVLVSDLHNHIGKMLIIENCVSRIRHMDGDHITYLCRSGDSCGKTFTARIACMGDKVTVFDSWFTAMGECDNSIGLKVEGVHEELYED